MVTRIIRENVIGIMKGDGLSLHSTKHAGFTIAGKHYKSLYDYVTFEVQFWTGHLPGYELCDGYGMYAHNEGLDQIRPNILKTAIEALYNNNALLCVALVETRDKLLMMLDDDCVLGSGSFVYIDAGGENIAGKLLMEKRKELRHAAWAMCRKT